MRLDQSDFTLITTMATISLAGSPIAVCDASGRAEPSRIRRFPIVRDDSDGLTGFEAQLQRPGHHSSLHFRDRQSEEQKALLQTPGHDHVASDVVDDELRTRKRRCWSVSAPPARWTCQPPYLL